MTIKMADVADTAFDIERILALENALEAAIQYMRLLPACPETYHQANKAEQVLSQQRSNASQTAYGGERYSPAGILIIKARVVGNEITVSSQNVDSMPAHFVRRHQTSLYRTLKEGVTVQLTQRKS